MFISESDHLKALWDKHASMSQARFGETYDIGTVSMVSQYLLGRRPLNLSAAMKFAKGLGLTLDEVCPRLADIAREASLLLASPALTKEVPLLTEQDAHLFAHNAITGNKTVPILIKKNASNCFAVEIHDEAMTPEVQKGDLAIIDTEITPIAGDLVLARIDGFQTLLRAYTPHLTENLFALAPANKLSPTFVSDKHKIEIIGVMVESRRFRKARHG